MNKLMQNLEDAKSALATAMEGTDADAIKAATEAVKAAQAAIDAAKEGEALIKSLGTNDGKKADEAKAARTLGEFAVKNLDLTALRIGTAKSAGTGFDFKAATDVHMSTPVEVVNMNAIDNVVRNLVVRNLFGTESINGTTRKYFVLGATEGAPTEVAEGAQKPQFHVPYDSASADLKKIAGWYYETDELIEDNALLRSSIDNRGLFELDQAVESFLMTTLLGTTGLGTIAQAPTADNIFEAMMQVKSASDLNADAIVINPTDYKTLRLAKDGGTSGQYYGGGYFYGPYGNGQIAQQPGIWGLNTVITNAVTAGTVLVGNFKQGASVFTKSGEGARVEIVTGDHDDRTNNRVTVIVEERLGLAVYRPGAFVKVSA
jgi:HK97 family phage major capsid protein